MRRNVSAKLKEIIKKFYNNKCAISGLSELKDGIKLHIDHIIPLDLDGSNYVENLIPIASHINLRKSNGRFSKKLELMLLGQANKNAAEILNIYARANNKKIPFPSDPSKADLKLIKKYIYPANQGFWKDVDKFFELIKYYIKHGAKALKEYAEKLGTTYRSCVCKLAYHNFYNASYAGIQ